MPPKSESLKDVLHSVFKFYCSYGDRLNFEHMNNFKFHRFYVDAKIPCRVTRQDGSEFVLDGTHLDMMWKKLLRRLAEQAAEKAMAEDHWGSRTDLNRHSQPHRFMKDRINFTQFVGLLCDIASIKFPDVSPSSAALKKLFTDHIYRHCPRFDDQPIQEPFADDPDVAARFKKNETALEMIFQMYSKHWSETEMKAKREAKGAETHTPSMAFDELMSFCRDFEISPRRVSTPALKAIFYQFQSDTDLDLLTFQEFVKALGECIKAGYIGAEPGLKADAFFTALQSSPGMSKWANDKGNSMNASSARKMSFAGTAVEDVASGRRASGASSHGSMSRSMSFTGSHHATGSMNHKAGVDDMNFGAQKGDEPVDPEYFLDKLSAETVESLPEAPASQRRGSSGAGSHRVGQHHSASGYHHASAKEVGLAHDRVKLKVNTDWTDPGDFTKKSVKALLHELFSYYCSFGDPLNVQYMSGFKFNKFVQDCRLTGRDLIKADVDLAFQKVLKIHSQGSKEGQGVLAGVGKHKLDACCTMEKGRLNFEQFVQVLTIVARRKYEKVTQSQVEAMDNLLKYYICPEGTRVLTRAYKVKGKHGNSKPAMCDEHVVRFLEEFQGTFRAMYDLFATHKPNATVIHMREPCVNFEEFSVCVRDFGIVPRHASVAQSGRIFRTVHRRGMFNMSNSGHGKTGGGGGGHSAGEHEDFDDDDESKTAWQDDGLTFPMFLEAMAELALVGDSYGGSTPVEQCQTLLIEMQDADGMSHLIEKTQNSSARDSIRKASLAPGSTFGSHLKDRRQSRMETDAAGDPWHTNWLDSAGKNASGMGTGDGYNSLGFMMARMEKAKVVSADDDDAEDPAAAVLPASGTSDAAASAAVSALARGSARGGGGGGGHGASPVATAKAIASSMSSPKGAGSAAALKQHRIVQEFAVSASEFENLNFKSLCRRLRELGQAGPSLHCVIEEELLLLEAPAVITDLVAQTEYESSRQVHAQVEEFKSLGRSRGFSDDDIRGKAVQLKDKLTGDVPALVAEERERLVDERVQAFMTDVYVPSVESLGGGGGGGCLSQDAIDDKVLALTGRLEEGMGINEDGEGQGEGGRAVPRPADKRALIISYNAFIAPRLKAIGVTVAQDISSPRYGGGRTREVNPEDAAAAGGLDESTANASYDGQQHSEGGGHGKGGGAGNVRGFNRMYGDLMKWKKDSEAWALAERNKALREEYKECTFKPNMNTPHFQAPAEPKQKKKLEKQFVARCYNWAQRKEKFLNEQRDEQIAEEISACTFAPEVNDFLGVDYNKPRKVGGEKSFHRRQEQARHNRYEAKEREMAVGMVGSSYTGRPTTFREFKLTAQGQYRGRDRLANSEGRARSASSTPRRRGDTPGDGSSNSGYSTARDRGPGTQPLTSSTSGYAQRHQAAMVGGGPSAYQAPQYSSSRGGGGSQRGQGAGSSDAGGHSHGALDTKSIAADLRSMLFD